MNHAELCSRAVRWLRRSAGCSVVLTELASNAREIPDAIGWRGGKSILIEAKVSRSDFLRDAKKLHRTGDGRGMGGWRFYMAPIGILTAQEIPHGWGLLEVGGTQVRRTYGVPKGNCYWHESPFRPDLSAERELLCSALRRYQEAGLAVPVSQAAIRAREAKR